MVSDFDNHLRDTNRRFAQHYISIDQDWIGKCLRPIFIINISQIVSLSDDRKLLMLQLDVLNGFYQRHRKYPMKICTKMLTSNGY